jgi:hypothetical protein
MTDLANLHSFIRVFDYYYYYYLDAIDKNISILLCNNIGMINSTVLYVSHRNR